MKGEMRLFPLLLLIWVTRCNAKLTSNTVVLGKCNATAAGTTSFVSDKDGSTRQLICVKAKGNFFWKDLRNFRNPTLGSIFNPAEDCSDIVRKKRDAKSGLYWIKRLGLKRPTKAWCDLTTDGGGFMLVGHKDSPVSWTMPSSPDVVLPQGKPHWSSKFGDVQMLEFRIQVSTTKNFADTKADWLYRFTTSRRLSELLTTGNNSGCTRHFPGIGRIEYVKDLSVNKIATRSFLCSRFGPAYPQGLGWRMMNTCVGKPCKNGYAVIPGTNYRYDNYGAFSYSTNSPRSGVYHNSTVFIGCEHGKCCACFGPKAATGDFCSPACQSINGGTVTKLAHAWFWVRTSVPESSVWNKCSEFQIKSRKGKLETHFVDSTTGILRKGTCVTKGIPNLVAGVVEVDNKKALDSIPRVKGLLSYREDNEKLYLTNGKRWQALGKESVVKSVENRLILQENKTINVASELRQMNTSQQKLISEFEKKMDKMEKKLIHELKNVNATLNAILKKKFKNCADIYKDGKKANGVYDIYPDNQGSFKVFCDMTTDGGGWTVFQRRQDGSVNFYRGWNDYKNGFGDLSREFWLGLDKIYRLTKSQKWVIRFDLEDFSGNTRYAKYSSFAVASESSKYRLSLGSYSGTAGDSLSYHNGMKFTTKDSDNDAASYNCAVKWKGGWWYNNCHKSNLNGLYHHGSKTSNSVGVNWYHWKGHNYSLKKTEMKIRPI